MVDGELLEGVDRDHRCAVIQRDRVVAVFDFAFMRLADGDRMRRFEACEQFGRVQIQLHLGAVMIVTCGDRRHVARYFRRPARTC